MSANKPAASIPGVEIDLRHPPTAALLAWLWPGAGHFYQGRHAKGVLFMVCILGIFFFGLAVGEGKVVYAGDSGVDPNVRGWRRLIQCWPQLLQAGVGLPAAPAVLQTMIVRNGGQPLLGGVMAPPRNSRELMDWNERLNIRFEMGTLYTMIAGLLSILAIYDAYAGPVGGEASDEKRPPPAKNPDDDKKKK